MSTLFNSAHPGSTDVETIPGNRASLARCDCACVRDLKNSHSTGQQKPSVKSQRVFSAIIRRAPASGLVIARWCRP